MEIWCNEAQERYVLLLKDENLEKFSDICEREKAPFAVIGKTTTEENSVSTTQEKITLLIYQ